MNQMLLSMNGQASNITNFQVKGLKRNLFLSFFSFHAKSSMQTNLFW